MHSYHSPEAQTGRLFVKVIKVLLVPVVALAYPLRTLLVELLQLSVHLQGRVIELNNCPIF